MEEQNLLISLLIGFLLIIIFNYFLKSLTIEKLSILKNSITSSNI